MAQRSAIEWTESTWNLREFFALLRCGILAHGFARVHCANCGKDALVAFSCKGRGFWPSRSVEIGVPVTR